MGASSAEIDRQITETREHLDANLAVLEERAKARAKVAIRIGAVAAIGVAAAVTAAILLKRRRERSSAMGRIDAALPESLKSLREEIATRLKKPLPAVRISVSGTDEPSRPGFWSSVAHKAAPAAAATGASAVVAATARRLARADDAPGAAGAGDSRRDRAPVSAPRTGVGIGGGI